MPCIDLLQICYFCTLTARISQNCANDKNYQRDESELLCLREGRKTLSDSQYWHKELGSISVVLYKLFNPQNSGFNNNAHCANSFPEKFRATPVFLPLLPTEDGELDGLELYKSVIHSLFEVRGGYAAESGQMPQVSEQKAKETEGNGKLYVKDFLCTEEKGVSDVLSELVDDLLLRYDLNEDALLNYKEFMKSFQENHKLNSV